MKLGLLCALAMAFLALAVADLKDSKKGKTLTWNREAGTRGGGRRRPHQLCSGCFSVLSEESIAMSRSTGDEAQAGRQERTRREVEKPAQQRRSHFPKPRRDRKRGAAVAKHSPAP